MTKCICSIPDSFNVRMSDLRNPRCPVHGVPIVDPDKATQEEIENLLFSEPDYVITSGDTSKIARKLLEHYDIRRKS